MSDDLGTPHLRLERRGPLAWVTIDRPEKRNAFTPAMYYGVRRALELVRADDDLRALVLTGTGDVFCPGGDLGLPEVPLPAGLGADFVPFRTMRYSPVPTVAAINGICQAGGCLLAMLADITVASERATFRFPDVLRGFPETWHAAVLPAHVGVARARDLLMTARRFDAREAHAMGLVARIAPHEELEAAATAAAYDMLEVPPGARAIVKDRINDHYGTPDQMTFDAGNDTPEAREGFAAFVEKRRPSWAPDRPV